MQLRTEDGGWQEEDETGGVNDALRRRENIVAFCFLMEGHRSRARGLEGDGCDGTGLWVYTLIGQSSVLNVWNKPNKN